MLDMPNFCRHFYASRFLPVSYREGDDILFSAGLPEGVAVSAYVVHKLTTSGQNPAVYTAEDSGLYGVVRIHETDGFLLLGPAYSAPVTSDTLRSFMLLSAVNSRRSEELRPYLEANPRYSFNRFLNLLAFLHLILNGEELDIAEHFAAHDPGYEKELAARHTQSESLARDERRQHGTYQFEQRMLDYVKRGETAALREFLLKGAREEALAEGKLADNALRQAKNIFIGTVTMVGKFGAIPGGLDVEQTYHLIDTYIQECERLSTVEAVMALQFNMLMDFTTRVWKARMPENLSKEVSECVQYIANHICDTIRVDDVAAVIGKSRAYTTAKFHRETGYSITEYVTLCRMREAKSLLQYTDMTIPEISDFLGFANQAHFQSVFKKVFETTPAKFRQQPHDSRA